MRRFWTPDRVRLLVIGYIISVAAAVAVLAFSARTPGSLLTEGDFPAFYAAAEIVRAGDAANLYNPDTQMNSQNKDWPEAGKGYHYFSYPPYVALLSSPLTLLEPHAARGAFCGLMALAIAVCAWLMVRIPGSAARNAVGAAAFLLALGPLLSGLGAGQNNALSLLLFALTIYLVARGKSFWAGVTIGLWAFKPQFALIVLPFVALSGNWAVLGGAAIPLGIYYMSGVAVMGWQWPMIWLKTSAWFQAQDLITNGHLMVSLMGFFDTARNFVRHIEPAAIALMALEAASVVVVLALVARRSFVVSRLENDTAKREALVGCLLLMGPAIALLSPHVMFYDIALAFAPAIYLVRMDQDRKITAALCLLAVLMALTLARDAFPLSPMLVYTIGAFALTYQLTDAKRRISSEARSEVLG